jgi:hypothetical protein
VTRQLIHQNFRYVNGQVADGEDVLVVSRSTISPVVLYSMAFGSTTLPNPIFTDESGNVSFYLDPGSYDFIVNDARVPFDITEGGGTDLYLFHDQDVPIATWTILHSFGRYPNVVLIDSANKMIMTDLEYPDLATVVATFPAPTTGKAILQA